MRRGVRVLVVLIAVTLLAGVLVYAALSRQIDERLASGWSPPPTRLFAAALELSRGWALDRDELVGWLDDLGYTERNRARGAGEFAVERHAITLIERDGATRGRTVRVRFGQDTAGTTRVLAIEIPPAGGTDRLALGAPLLSTLHAGHAGERRKRRDTPLSQIPQRVIQAVLAAEDSRFFEHHGVDAVRIAGATVTNLIGNRGYLVGASTVTQQLVKNTLLSPAQTISRKLHEQALAILLERRLSKARILELYMNNVYLGQQGSFAIHGVAQGARALFGTDLQNLSLGEAATMAGIIQAPQLHAPDRHPDRAQARRNGVLQAMVEQQFLTPDEALAAAREPIRGVADTADVEAPYFVDLVNKQLNQALPDHRAGSDGLQIATTLDAHLQRLAEDAVREGLRRMLPDAAAERPQAALIAVEPGTGAIRALVGGGSYRSSQFNRVERARRQPGSIVKPFVYLAALERARRDPAFPFTPASLIDDTPTTFVFDRRSWRPANYGDIYDGPVTARLALARSRNVAAVKVAELTGFREVADLWAASSGGATPPAYPSLALGVFEATPLEVAVAYTALANGGIRVPLTAIARVRDGDGVIDLAAETPRRVASADSAFLVTQMLESALDTGTAAGARRQGFHQDAAGKTGTTDGLRDAWFAGFTPTLLTVVWVGVDDGSPLGLTGAQAALPIWTHFMRRALDGRESPDFSPPAGITFVDVDPATGLRATPRCPATIHEAFREGTEPHAACPLH
jgi:penicillin-binding protein 1B